MSGFEAVGWKGFVIDSGEYSTANEAEHYFKLKLLTVAKKYPHNEMFWRSEPKSVREYKFEQGAMMFRTVARISIKE